MTLIINRGWPIALSSGLTVFLISWIAVPLMGVFAPLLYLVYRSHQHDDGTAHQDAPPPPSDYRKLATRVVDLHPLTIAQNARTSGGGNISMVPTRAITVGPLETWKAEKVSIWHAGSHDNPFGQRLTAFMISKRIIDTSVPMSLLADHPNVQFNYFRGGIGTCAVEMH